MQNLHLEQFASDNYSGMCPEVIQSMTEANVGCVPAYGNDKFTLDAANKIREIFEIDCEVFFVFNGTAANSLALASLCRSYHSVICHELAHVETDECGAPEFFSNGSKLLLAKGENGKLNPDSIREVASKREDIHYPKPKVISVTQATEVGTVYSVDELKKIKEVANEFDMYIQMDGARFSNALTSLNVTPAEITWKVGVDVLCFCGTKNGMAMGEAVVFFNKNLAEDFAYRCKQAGQLASKMRFISAQWLGLLKNDLWLKNAAWANEMAQYFVSQVKDIEGIEFMFPVEANAVFIETNPKLLELLKQREWLFYTFIGLGGARFVFSWGSTKKRVDELIKDIKECKENLLEQ